MLKQSNSCVYKIGFFLARGNETDGTENTYHQTHDGNVRGFVVEA